MDSWRHSPAPEVTHLAD